MRQSHCVLPCTRLSPTADALGHLAAADQRRPGALGPDGLDTDVCLSRRTAAGGCFGPATRNGHSPSSSRCSGERRLEPRQVGKAYEGSACTDSPARAGQPRTAGKRRRIRDSREKGTELLPKAIAGQDPKPGAFLCASAIGYYGSRGDGIVTEDSEAGTGFLAGVGKVWEAATRASLDSGVRVVKLRFSLVLGRGGGLLAKMLTPSSGTTAVRTFPSACRSRLANFDPSAGSPHPCRECSSVASWYPSNGPSCFSTDQRKCVTNHVTLQYFPSHLSHLWPLTGDR